ncbi:uncharacterized protein J3D65DRAFT_269153 [Phyllosticta citribraziliensis]|uniref:Zn(2)-C6 fungal-type domain-containing protein n=1 Tax=Phyllosticta citribraziliensis TaxID=989973 RepID=A0ABR1M468_9PEZI
MHTSSRADPPKRPERLRDSCNSCAQAKVRCTRDKPICARCATKSLRCDYSPSMRKGKQRTTGGSISSTKKTSSAGSPRKSPERMHDDQKSSFPGSQKRTSYHHFPPTDQKLRTPSPTIPWNDNVWSSAGVSGMGNGTFPGLFPQDIFAMPYIPPAQPDFFPACDPPPTTFGNDSMNLDCAGIGAFADLSGYVGGDGAVSMGAMDDMDIAMLGNDNDSMTALGQLHQQEQQQWQTDAYSHGSPSAMSSCSTSVGTPRTNESTLPHDCMAQALEMMAQVNSTPPEGGSGVPLEIRILVRNKTIVDSIAQILQCGLCMQEMRTPHILTILTISLIASYHSVLRSFASDHGSSGSSDNSPSSSASSSTTTTPPPHPASTSLPNTTTTNTIAPALAALSGLGIDATTTTHGAQTAPSAPGMLHCGAGYGPLPPSVPRPAPTTSNPLMSMSSDAKSRMQIIFTELARVRTLVDAMADALRECGRAFDERAAAAPASNDDGNTCAGGDGGSGRGVGGGGGDAENLTHSAVLAQLEKVLRAKERSVFQAVVRAVR